MENWDTSVVYGVVSAQHQERLARGEKAERLLTLLGQTSVRARFAAALVALAARLTPEPSAPPETRQPATPGATA